VGIEGIKNKSRFSGLPYGRESQTPKVNSAQSSFAVGLERSRIESLANSPKRKGIRGRFGGSQGTYAQEILVVVKPKLLLLVKETA
jgi:hypothetical protein